MKGLFLPGGYVTWISDEDFDFVINLELKYSPGQYVTADCVGLHRLIAERMGLPLSPRGTHPFKDTLRPDHRDRNRLNNQRSNLRSATPSQNAANRSRNWDRKNKLKGVRRSGKRFVATICFELRKIHIGTFDTAGEAHAAYLKMAGILHGEFATDGK